MIASDEDNYKEAIEASFKVFAPRGISKFSLKTHLLVLDNVSEIDTSP